MAVTVMHLCIFLVCFVLVNADKEPVYAQERGFAVGLINRAKLDCKRQTKNGDHISVRYNGTFIDGSTYVPAGNKPFEFTLGEGQVIPGWDLGLLGTCVGEIRHLVVPSQLGYGNWAAGDKVPPKSTIEFFVEVLEIKDTIPEKDLVSDKFKEIDTNHDRMLSHEEVARYLKKEQYPNGAGEKSHAYIIKDIFDEEDKDSDGRISHDEFSGPKRYIDDL